MTLLGAVLTYLGAVRSRSERGATAVEYGLLLVMSVIVALILGKLGHVFEQAMQMTMDAFSG